MFNNVGEKIKGVAIAIFILEIIGCFFCGLLIITKAKLKLVGCLILFLGPIAAYVSALIPYGFGELIDKACKIERKIGKVTKKPEETIIGRCTCCGQMRHLVPYEVTDSYGNVSGNLCIDCYTEKKRICK